MARKFRHLKLFSLLGISILTSIGVISGFSLANKGAERVDAANVPANTNVYLNTSSFSSWNDGGAIFKMWFKKNGSDCCNSDGVNVNVKGSSDKIYVFKPTAQFDSIYVERCNPAGGGHWNGFDITADAEKNVIKVNDWNAGSYDSSKNYNIYYQELLTSTGGSISSSTASGSTSYGSGYYYAHNGIKLTATPSTGYKFSKWKKNGSDSVSTNPYTISALTSDATWQGVFSLNEYTISYNKGTYGEGTNESDTKYYGTPINLRNAIFTRDGYLQTGWASDAAGTTLKYNLGESYTQNSSITLYPYWTQSSKPTHTVTYDINGGTGTVPTQAPVEEDSEFTIASSTGFSKQHYHFTAWNDGTNNYQPGASYTMGTSNVTFTAQWAEDTKYTVTFKSEDGLTPLHTTQVYSGETATYGGVTPTKPSTDIYDYTFDKWVTEAYGSTAASLDNITEDKTVYAHFAESYKNGYYLNNFTKGEMIPLIYNSVKGQYEGAATLAKDDEFKVVSYKNKAIEWYNDAIDGNRYDSALYVHQLSHAGTGLNIVCEVAGTYNVYFKFDSSQNGTIFIPAQGNWFDVTLVNGDGVEPYSLTIKGFTGLSLRVEANKIPTKPNNTFMGYYDATYTTQYIKADGTSEHDITETSSFTLYAKWVRSSISAGEAVYLDCNNIVGGDNFRWDDGDAHFKVYLWRDGLTAIELKGRNLVHGIDGNEHVYEFIVPENSTEYFTYVKFERWDKNYSQRWDETGNLGFVYGTNAFSITSQTGSHSDYSWNITTEMREEYYAKYFMSTCTCNGSSYTFEPAKWNDVKAEYNNMCKAAKDGFKNVTAQTGSEYTLENAAGRYDELVSKRAFENFAGRSVSPSSSKFISFVDMVSNSPILIAVIISIISVSAIGAYFYLRKRKED